MFLRTKSITKFLIMAKMFHFFYSYVTQSTHDQVLKNTAKIETNNKN